MLPDMNHEESEEWEVETIILHSKYRHSYTNHVTANFTSIPSSPALGPKQPPINGYRGFLPWGVKRQGREADHLPLTSAYVKKIWVYTSTTPHIYML
jgi:hypothetical protein